MNQPSGVTHDCRAITSSMTMGVIDGDSVSQRGFVFVEQRQQFRTGCDVVDQKGTPVVNPGIEDLRNARMLNACREMACRSTATCR